MWKFYAISTIVILSSCVNDVDEVNAITSDEVFQIEEAKHVVITYSDSADVKVRITADKMIRHNSKSNPYDEFPEGIFVEFLGARGAVNSWLEADRAIRKDREDEVIARGNVKFYNKKQETLTSTELIWDEDEQKLHTNKYVRITQPMKGDTSSGFGFEANEEFTQFEIKRKTSSRFNIDDITRQIDDKKNK